MANVRTLRDAGGRLTVEVTGVDHEAYGELTHRVADQFGLTKTDRLIAGPDSISWEFCASELSISLDWDIWSGFMVVAKQPESELLVRAIGEFLTASDGDSP